MSLTSIAAPIWNDIAKTQTLKTQWARHAFSLDGMDLAELEDQEYKTLKTKVSSEVASAYLTVKPLLLENVAISKYIQANPQYREAFIEITTIAEAVMVATEEHWLNHQQQIELTRLLKEDYSQ